MKAITLLKGEVAHNNAPKAALENGMYCVPQHYLVYQHTLNSIEALMLSIEYSTRYPIFVSEENDGIYLQVGIVGIDNYLNAQQSQKIVYGRKWRVEPNLPTSEIIQTVFLAIKKAREHEVRELFRLTIENKVTTPFNNHHDLPMLSNSDESLQSDEMTITWPELQSELDNIRYDQAGFYILNIEQRDANYCLLELELITDLNTSLPELLENKVVVLVIKKLTLNEVLHHLMDHLVNLSDLHVNENFTYANVARFSRNKSVKSIAMISANTRFLHKKVEQSEFAQQWQQGNYDTDLTRVPQLKPSILVDKIKKSLACFAPLAGIHPQYK